MDVWVDGERVPVPVLAPTPTSADSVAWWLRDLGRTGVRIACEEGICGACMVLVDGTALPSCLLPVARLHSGSRIETAHSLSASPEGEGLIRALAAESAVQCGFCLPGILASCVAAHRAGQDLSDEDRTRDVLSSHICRCSGYNGLVRAITGNGADTPGPRAQETARKAAGEALFALDQVPDNALFARLLRARGPHSRVEIDRERLLAMPGIVAVLGPEDDPGVPFTANTGGGREDMAVFSAEARFPGDVIGAVVGHTRAAVRAAVQTAASAGAIRESPLPAVLTVAAARAPDAPPAHRGFPDSGNVLGTFTFGATAEDVDRALAACEHVFTGTYRVDPTTHAFLEPVTATVAAAPDGGLRVWSNTQCPIPSRGVLARLLQVPSSTITYQQVALGGSFGGKEDFLLEAVAALASRAVGDRPVVVETDRRELTGEFRLRHPFEIEVTTGCDAAGRIAVRQVRATVAGGPYALHAPSVLANGLNLAMSLYPAPVLRATGECVALNRVPGGAYRGYGAPQVLFAVEAQLDEMATALGLAPVELRRINILRSGAVDPVHGWEVKSFDMPSCLTAAEHCPPLDRRTTHPRLRRGRGFAALANISGVTASAGPDSASAECEFRDGRLVVLTAVPDMGQGLHALLAATAAAELGIPADLVDVEFDPTGKDWGGYASRGSYLTASAVALAARDLRVTTPEGADVTAAGRRGRGTFRAPDNALVAGAQVVDVEVDTATGAVRVLRVTSIHDAGRLILPDVAREQVVGGVIQALGNALLEELPFSSDGAVAEPTLLALGVPRSLPAVEVEAVFVGSPHPEGPLGAKGVAESPVIGIAAAVSSAIADATGVRLREAPFTAERVWRALREARQR